MFFHFQLRKNSCELSLKMLFSKARVTLTDIPKCCRGLEPMDANGQRCDGKMNAKSLDHRILRVSGRQPSNVPFMFSCDKSWHHGFQNVETANKRTRSGIYYWCMPNCSRQNFECQHFHQLCNCNTMCPTWWLSWEQRNNALHEVFSGYRQQTTLGQADVKIYPQI